MVIDSRESRVETQTNFSEGSLKGARNRLLQVESLSSVLREHRRIESQARSVIGARIPYLGFEMRFSSIWMVRRSDFRESTGCFNHEVVSRVTGGTNRELAKDGRRSSGAHLRAQLRQSFIRLSVDRCPDGTRAE